MISLMISRWQPPEPRRWLPMNTIIVRIKPPQTGWKKALAA